MQENESVDQILKEIFIKACQEYLDQPKKPNTIDKFTKSYIVEKTGIDKNTLKRYLDSSAKSYPNLVEVMEALRIVNKKEYLLEFGKRSSCQAALFVKEFYPIFIKSHQIESEIIDDTQSSNKEILRIINVHQATIDSKLKDNWKTVIWILGAWMLAAYVVVLWKLDTIELLLKK